MMSFCNFKKYVLYLFKFMTILLVIGLVFIGYLRSNLEKPVILMSRYSKVELLKSKCEALKRDKKDIDKCKKHIKEMLKICKGNEELVNGSLAGLYNSLKSSMSYNFSTENALVLLEMFDGYVENKSELYSPMHDYYKACDQAYKKYGYIDIYYKSCLTAYNDFIGKTVCPKHQKWKFTVKGVGDYYSTLKAVSSEQTVLAVEKELKVPGEYNFYLLQSNAATGRYRHYLFTKNKYRNDEKIDAYFMIIGEANPIGDCYCPLILLEEDGIGYANQKIELNIAKQEWEKESKKYIDYTKGFSPEEHDNIKCLRQKLDERFVKHYFGGGRLYFYVRPPYCIEDLQKKTNNF